MSAYSASIPDLGERVKQWLRDTAYPGEHKAKRIAREWDVSESTAKAWLAGQRPGKDWVDRMAQRWGWPFLAFVYQPVCATSETDVLARLYRLQEQYDQFKQIRAGDDIVAAGVPMVARVASDALASHRPSAHAQSLAADRPVAGPQEEVDRRRASGRGRAA